MVREGGITSKMAFALRSGESEGMAKKLPMVCLTCSECLEGCVEVNNMATFLAEVNTEPCWIGHVHMVIEGRSDRQHRARYLPSLSCRGQQQ